MSEAPKRIWISPLNSYEAHEDIEPPDYQHGVWYPHDLSGVQKYSKEYVRADLHTKSEAENARLREAFAYIMDGYGLDAPKYEQSEGEEDDWIVAYLRRELEQGEQKEGEPKNLLEELIPENRELRRSVKTLEAERDAAKQTERLWAAFEQVARAKGDDRMSKILSTTCPLKAGRDAAYRRGIEDAARVAEGKAYFTAREMEKMSDLVKAQEASTLREDRKVYRIAAAIRALADKPKETTE